MIWKAVVPAPRCAYEGRLTHGRMAVGTVLYDRYRIVGININEMDRPIRGGEPYGLRSPSQRGCGPREKLFGINRQSFHDRKAIGGSQILIDGRCRNGFSPETLSVTAY